MSYHRMNENVEPVVIFTQDYYYENSCTRCYQQCCRRGRYHITHQQAQALTNLRSLARLSFNPSNECHLQSLRQLWRLNWPDKQCPQDTIDQNWKSIGFQSRNPSNDFRGAGFLGLQHLIFLATSYPQEYQTCLKSAQDYSFAISSLNITYQLTHLLQLNQRNTQGLPGTQRASPAEMKAFCSFNLVNDGIFDMIFAGTVLKMHQIWVEMNKTEKVTIMEFNRAIEGAVNFLRLVLRESRDLEEFSVRLFNS